MLRWLATLVCDMSPSLYGFLLPNFPILEHAAPCIDSWPLVHHLLIYDRTSQFPGQYSLAELCLLIGLRVWLDETFLFFPYLSIRILLLLLCLLPDSVVRSTRSCIRQCSVGTIPSSVAIVTSYIRPTPTDHYHLCGPGDRSHCKTLHTFYLCSLHMTRRTFTTISRQQHSDIIQ